MFTFKKEGIDKNEKLQLVKLFKEMKTALDNGCNQSDELREGLERLVIETFFKIPNILYVYDDKNIGVIDLIIKHKLWGALIEVAKKEEFVEYINNKLIKARDKAKKEEKVK